MKDKNKTITALLEIPVNTEEVHAIQIADVAADTYVENIAKILSNHPDIVHTDAFQAYQNKQIAANVHFETLKANLEKNYIPECIYGKFRYDWNLTYITNMLSVTVYDPQGIELLRNAGIPFQII